MNNQTTFLSKLLTESASQADAEACIDSFDAFCTLLIENGPVFQNFGWVVTFINRSNIQLHPPKYRPGYYFSIQRVDMSEYTFSHPILVMFKNALG